MSAQGIEDYSFLNNNGGSHTGRLPEQLIPQSKKNNKWIELNLDTLETITSKQIVENQPLEDYYAMVNGDLVYSDYGLEGFAKNVVDLSNQMEMPSKPKHYDFLGVLTNQVCSDWITSKVGMHIDNTDEFSQNDFLRELDRKKSDYITNNFSLELKRRMLERGFNLDGNKQFESQEEQQQYAQELQAQQDQLIDPELQQKTLQKTWKSVATEWAEKRYEDDNNKYDLENRSRKEMEDRFFTGRYFTHFEIGYDYYKPVRWHPPHVAFSKDLNIKYPQDAEYVCHQTEMSASAIINRFGYKLTEDIQKRLMNSYTTTGVSSNLGYNGSLQDVVKSNFGRVEHIPFDGYYEYQNTLQEQQMFNEPMGVQTYIDPQDGVEKQRPAWFSPINKGGGFMNGYNSNLRESRLDFEARTDTLLVTECYWRSFKQVGILNYINADGYLDQEFTTDDLVPQFLRDNEIQTLRKVSLEEATKNREPNTIAYTWIPEIRWGVKIRSYNTQLLSNIYIGGEALPYQIKGTLDGGSNLYDAKIPVAGIITDSIAKRIRNEIINHNIVLNQLNNLLEKELGTFFLFDIKYLPSEYKGSGNTRQALEQMWDLIQDIGIVPIDTSRQNIEGGQPAMNAFSTQNIDYTPQITNRMNLANQFKIMAIEKIGMNSQRIGEVSQYTTAEGIKQGQTASYAQTEGLFAEMMTAEKRKVLLHLTIAQYCQKNNIDYLSVYTNSDSEKAFIELSDNFFQLREFGLRLESSSNSKKELESLRAAVLSSNTLGSDLLDVAEILTSKSMTTIKSHLRQNRIELQKSTQDQRAHEQEIVDKQIADAKEAREDLQAHETELKRMDNETDLEVKKLDAYGKMSINQNADSTLYDRLDTETERALNNDYKNREFDIKDRTLKIQEQNFTKKEDKDSRDFDLRVKTLAEKIEARKSTERISIINKN
jgi:hypothetical protein